ncbi:MAG: hypothetical protein JO286_12115 [Solirubrobacterales bacterium]|nr:hypothetical protein [Solirubrobacterales bacterium]MBV9365570.1 hypothetical protein [Solirubrobacterales bacterium]MBV9681094.1 hypothetical protein [Solirubrobacterales bacterium]MBV9807925.1 hypothetical protein [Solirubrobacterales bacterium]
MNPLLFVDWRAVSSMFRGLMWLVAIVLAGLIVVHLLLATPPVHHSMQIMR